MGRWGKVYHLVSPDQGAGSTAPLSDLPDRIRFLCEAACFDKRHSGASLLLHLVGTYEVLAEWGSGQELSDAGLFHSVYGTETYPDASVPTERRDRLRELIGARAEGLVWIFCDMALDSFTLALMQDGHGPRTIVSRRSGVTYELDYSVFRDLCHLAAANLIEQRDRIQADRQQELYGQLARLGGHVGPLAAHTISSLRAAH